MNKNWYDHEKNIADAITFVLQYSCIYGWTAFASDKTFCKAEKKMPATVLKELIKNYVEEKEIKKDGNC